MTAMPPPPPAAAGLPTLDVSGTPATPFGRLVLVEWRKLIDTRGGMWLFLSVAALLGVSSTLALLLAAFNDDFPVTAAGMSSFYSYLMLLVLPLFAIFTVTSEWSQRTALTSFTLEPQRMRVMAAKWAAVSLLAVAALVVATLLGAAVTGASGALGGEAAGEWNLAASRLLWSLLEQMVWFWVAFGLAMAFLNTPATIATYYVLALVLPFILLPIALTLFSATGWEGATDAMPWLHLFYAAAPVVDGSGWDGNGAEAIDYVRFVVTAAWWVGLPLGFGLARVRRAEVK